MTVASARFKMDWTVPVWGVMGLFVQGIAIVWLIASMNAQVQNDTARLDKVEVRMAATDTVVTGMSASLARIDERTRLFANSLSQPQPQPQSQLRVE